MSNALSVTALIVVPLIFFLFLIGSRFAWVKRLIFPVLSITLLLLIGIAAFKDNSQRDYIAIQDQYKAQYGGDLTPQIQQEFPAFAAAKEGDTPRVERCISCHVPDIETIGPQAAAQRLHDDFFADEPNATQIAKDNGITLSSTHPAIVDSSYYAQYGATSKTAAKTYSYKDTKGNSVTVALPGYLQSNLDPAAPSASDPTQPQKALGIDQTGCITCHNGNRLALTEADAHQNLIINPEYTWTAGAQEYYASCAACHGSMGQGDVGPPLSNQDRLGFFNEDYYYRCIEYGMTGFEHYGSVMPNWGSIAVDYNEAANPPGVLNGHQAPVLTSRVLSEAQITLMTQFIRHWEAYSTLP